MVIGLLCLGSVLAVFVVLGRRRKQRLAGLDATRPVFHSDPPRRSVSSRKHEAL